MVENVEITAKPPDKIGKRSFMARCNGTEYPDKFDPSSAYHRKKYRDSIIARFDLPNDEATHKDLESQLLDFVDGEIAAETSKRNDDEPKQSQASLLVELTIDNCELWHSDGCDAHGFASFKVDAHREHWPIRSRHFKRWLAHRFYDAHGKAPGGQGLADALVTVEGRALFDGKSFTPQLRVAGDDDAILIDLCDDAWQIVRIDSDGWEVIDVSGIRFRRTKATAALPTPARGGDLSELRQFLNVRDEDWPLVIAWLLAAMRPRGPYPLLALHGEQGSSKSTTARVLRSLVDPNLAPIRCEPREARELAIAANNAWIVALDNLSRVPVWLSDALCRLSTGGGFSTRTLYENDDETIFDAQRPVILTGIEELATRSDLLDRSLVTHLPRIAESKRQPESRFWRDFELARAPILGSLFDIVVAALRQLPHVELDQLPRMADFALWATAAETSIGLPNGGFLACLRANQDTANLSALESSPVARHLYQLAREYGNANDGGALRLTATDWLGRLNEVASDAERKSKSWPKAANALSGRIKRIAPNLRRIGVAVEFDQPTRGDRRKLISLGFCPQKTGNIENIDHADDIEHPSIEINPGKSGAGPDGPDVSDPARTLSKTDDDTDWFDVDSWPVDSIEP